MQYSCDVFQSIKIYIFIFQAFLLLGPALQFFTFILNRIKLFYKAIILTSANWSKFSQKQEKKLGIEDIPGEYSIHL